MKNSSLILGTLLLFILSACTKTYACRCTNGTPNVISSETEIKAKNKKEAAEKCIGDECGIY